MREYLFRGKRINNGEWIEGSLLVTKFNTYIIPMYDEFISYVKPVSVLSETVGQYTGLSDKNGVKIFEGDILKADSWRFYWIVQFDDKRARFNCIINPQGNCNDFIPADKVEVIGNIHDNSNLIK